MRNKMKTFALSAMICKDGAGERSYRQVLGYRRKTTADEAKGNFLTHIQNEYVGYEIMDFLCIEIPNLP